MAKQMKLPSRIIGLLSLITLIFVTNSEWRFSSPILPYFLILIILSLLAFEIYQLAKRKVIKRIIILISIIIGILLTRTMYGLYPILKSESLIAKETHVWDIGDYKIKRYKGRFKMPTTLQSYYLYEYGFLKTVIKRIDYKSFQDTILHDKIIFEKTKITFDRVDLKIKLP